MSPACPSEFHVHWSPVPAGEAADLPPPGCRLLAVWPAPVNHDACFQAAGFTLFGDNDETWDQAAENLLHRVLAHLSRLGAPTLASPALRDDPPWYLRPFRTGQELPLPQQALLPMLDDALPGFHAHFGREGAALRTGSGHFLLWISLPDNGSDPAGFVRTIAAPWKVVETALRWAPLLPDTGRQH
jgi:hypothetical protein